MSQVNKGEIMSHACKQEHGECQSSEVKPITHRAQESLLFDGTWLRSLTFQCVQLRSSGQFVKVEKHNRLLQDVLDKNNMKTATAEREEKQGKPILFVS